MRTAPIPEDAWWHYVVYQSPQGYPGKIAVHGWVILRGREEPVPTTFVVLYDSLDRARAELSAGSNLVRFPRADSDDPSIVETWM